MVAKSITKLSRTVGYGDIVLTTQTINKAGGITRQRIIEDMLTYRENRMKQLGYFDSWGNLNKTEPPQEA